MRKPKTKKTEEAKYLEDIDSLLDIGEHSDEDSDEEEINFERPATQVTLFKAGYETS